MQSTLLQLHFHSRYNTWLQWIGQRQLQDQARDIYILWFGVSYITGLTVLIYRHFDSVATDMPVQKKSLSPNLAASRLHEI